MFHRQSINVFISPLLYRRSLASSSDLLVITFKEKTKHNYTNHKPSFYAVESNYLHRHIVSNIFCHTKRKAMITRFCQYYPTLKFRESQVFLMLTAEI